MARKKNSGRNPNGMGSIYKDGDGYRVALKVGHDPVTGKPRYRKARVKTHEEATATLRRLSVEQMTGRLTAASGMTVSTYLSHWLETRVKPPMRAPSTYRQYSWLAKDHIEPLLGKKKLDKVTRAEVQKLISAKVDQKVSPRDREGTSQSTQTLSRNTLRLIRAVLHAAYSDAIKDGYAAHNPAEHVEVPAATKRPAMSLKADEAGKLFRALAETELELYFWFELITGTRIGEATGVRWPDLDLEERRARICGQLQRIDGRLQYRATTKTNQDRIVPISAALAERLKRLWSERSVNGQLTDPDEIVFLNSEGRRLDPKYVSNRLRDLCIAADIPVISPHKLRHTAATLALSATGDLHAVQKLLGHKQVSLTADLYGHATIEAMRGATDAIGRAIEG